MPNEHLAPRETPITAGEHAPQFTLLDQNKNEWSLKDALKKGDVVLCFYPLDFSPVCATEMSCVTTEFQRLEQAGLQVIGISCDSFYAHKAWADSLGLKQTLLADMHREVCKAYGFYFEDLNVASRGTIVIGSDGVVKWVQQRELSEAMSLDDVLASIS